MCPSVTVGNGGTGWKKRISAELRELCLIDRSKPLKSQSFVVKKVAYLCLIAGVRLTDFYV